MSAIEKAARLARSLAVIALLAVALASLMPNPSAMDTEPMPVVNALGHVIMHFVVTVCFLAGWHERASRTAPLMAAVAVGLEVLQVFVPSREFDLGELIGNLAGFGLGWAFFLSLRRFSRSDFI